MKERKLAKPFFDETRELYEELERRQNRFVESAAKEGAMIVPEGRWQAIKLGKLEKFVERIAANTAPNFSSLELHREKPPQEKSLLEEYFLQMRGAQALLCEQLEHSPYVSVFFRACRELGVFGQDLNKAFHPSMTPGEGRFMYQYELYNDVIKRVGELLETPQVKEEIRERVADAGNNYNSAIRYIDHLLEKYPKIFVLRIDFGYHLSLSIKDENEFLKIGIDQLNKDFTGLIKKLGRQKEYPEFIGHLAKIEFGKDRGYAMHAILLLDGSQDISESDWISMLEDLWVNKVTLGKGTAYNCRQEDDSTSPEKGYGLVVGGSPKHRDFERWMIGYVAKSCRFIRVKVGYRKRSFFKGTISQKFKLIDTSSPKLSTNAGKKQKPERTRMSGESPEIREMKAVYERLAEYQSSWDIPFNGLKPSTPDGPSLWDLMYIEELAMLMKEDKRKDPFVLYRSKDYRLEVEAKPLGECLRRIKGENVPRYADEHKLSPYVVAFCRVYWWDRHKLFRSILRHERQLFEYGKRVPDQDMVDACSRFMSDFRNEIDEKKVRKLVNSNNSSSNSLYKEACEYVDSLFEKEPDISVFSMDLCIGRGVNWEGAPVSDKSWTEWSGEITKFLSKSRLPMSNRVGYLGRWDWTAAKGWHVHMVLFMRGKKVTNDEEVQCEFRDLWVGNITKTEGSYHRVDHPSGLAVLSSVAHIKSSDRKRRDVLRDLVVAYFAKSDIYYQHDYLWMPVKFIRGQKPESKPRKEREKKVVAKSSQLTPKADKKFTVRIEIRKAKSSMQVKGQDQVKESTDANSDEMDRK